MIRLAIAGVGGRMGREVLAAAIADERFAVVGGTVRSGSVLPVVAAGLRLADDPRAIVPDADVVVDFSTPASSLAHAAVCAEYGVPLVCGTTGFDAAQERQLRAHGDRIPLVHARNTSAGIAALLTLLPTLAELMGGSDVEIVETHHRHKADAPSGTALALAEAVGGGPLVHGRHGRTPRRRGEIGIHAVRGGGNPGEHVVLFVGEGEEIRISHRVFGRRAYADGALRAAAALIGRPPGVYDPTDLWGGQAAAPANGAAPDLSERELAGA